VRERDLDSGVDLPRTVSFSRLLDRWTCSNTNSAAGCPPA